MQQRLIAAITCLLVVWHCATAAPPPPLRLPLILHDAAQPVLISALLYDGMISGEGDEAFQLTNRGNDRIDLTGWGVSSGTRTAHFPAGWTLAPYATIWCGRSAVAFGRAFGHPPDCEYAEDSDPTVPNLTGGALQFGNTGGRLALMRPDGRLVDVVVYKAGDATLPGWCGPAVAPYRPTNSFSEAGQILYRKLDARFGLPLADTDTAADWAQDAADGWQGKKARYPGWNLERFSRPAVSAERAALQIIIAPDHALTALTALLASATESIHFEGYTFESPQLAEALAAGARRGVDIMLLLDGAPAGGVSMQQRWCVQQIEASGGRVYYLRSDGSGLRKRYLYQHAKFWLLDNVRALVGSENPGLEAFPLNNPADRTAGRRGVYFVTDAPGVVQRLSEILIDDLDPGSHADIWRWEAGDAKLGAPPADFIPLRGGGGETYPVRFPHPLLVDDSDRFEVVQAPEAAVHADVGLFSLLSRAGAGDTVLIEQLYEHTYWGPGVGDIVTDPNPRLDAYLAAARRGATVRVLLDAYFDDQNLADPRSNLRTAEYLTATAAREGLDLQARRGNPTGRGIHNKMVLAEIRGEGWVMAGSLNGGEVSAKLNREVALIASSDAAYAYLAGLFWGDWAVSGLW